MEKEGRFRVVLPPAFWIKYGQAFLTQVTISSEMGNEMYFEITVNLTNKHTIPAIIS